MFDLSGISDSSYLTMLARFNSIQLGFRLIQRLDGRFNPINQGKYQNSTHCEYNEFIALRCVVGSPLWMKA
jgi:hypothetical protein